MSRHFLGPVLAAVLLVTAKPALALTAGDILTNFTYGSFELMSGEAGGEVVAGYDTVNVPNSQSAWVLITDAPQLCLQTGKQADDGDWNPITTVVPGGEVCFTISYSNCGNISVESITLTDMMPANTVRWNTQTKYTPGLVPNVPRWATGLDGPWSSYDMLGQEGPLYIRWIIPKLGIGISGYIKYCVDVL